MAATAAVPTPAWAAPAKAASPGFGRATEISLPANAATKPMSGLYAVSCSAKGDCSAGGAYEADGGVVVADVVTQSRGRWARAVEVRLPANAADSPSGQVNGMSCTAPGNCVAVGYYTTATTGNRSFIVREQDGRWSQAFQAPDPAHTGGGVGLEAIACTGPRSCQAVGSYANQQGDFEGLAVSETRSGWGHADEIAMPSNAAADPDAGLDGVACTAAGDCVAMGYYDNNPANSHVEVAAAVVESGGTWRRAVALHLPSHGPALDSGGSGVTCTANGHCLGVGSYNSSAQIYHSLAVTESGGRWTWGKQITAMPTHAVSAGMDGIGCVSDTLCFAAGGYDSTSNVFYGLLSTWSDGRWSHSAGLALPANARITDHGESALYSVSCARSGYCAAVGYYWDKAGTEEPMAVTRP
jgi:hypothetical protein